MNPAVREKILKQYEDLKYKHSMQGRREAILERDGPFPVPDASVDPKERAARSVTPLVRRLVRQKILEEALEIEKIVKAAPQRIVEQEARFMADKPKKLRDIERQKKIYKRKQRELKLEKTKK